MSEIFETPIINIAPGELSVDDVRLYSRQYDGQWHAAAFIDRGESRTILALGYGESRNSVRLKVAKLALSRVRNGSYGLH